MDRHTDGRTPDIDRSQWLTLSMLCSGELKKAGKTGNQTYNHQVMSQTHSPLTHLGRLQNGKQTAGNFMYQETPQDLLLCIKSSLHHLVLPECDLLFTAIMPVAVVDANS